jgi:hypothetical protein
MIFSSANPAIPANPKKEVIKHLIVHHQELLPTSNEMQPPDDFAEPLPEICGRKVACRVAARGPDNTN